MAVIAIVILLPLVALASRPEGSGAKTPLLGDDPARVAFDVITYMVLMAALLGLAIIVWALWPRPGEEMPPLPRRRHPLAMALALTAAVLVAVWLRSHRLGQFPALAPGTAAGQAAGGVPRITQSGRAAAAGGVDVLALAIVAGIVLCAAFLTWRAVAGKTPRRRRTALARVEAVLDDAIQDVLAEDDPRRAVIKAWARLERLLARYGLGRRDSEAPLEYAARAREGLGIDGISLERLADLFEWARFSVNEVTPAMRQEALDGLLAVRDGLRVAA